MFLYCSISAGTYLFQVNNLNIIAMCEICSNLTVNTPNAFVVNLIAFIYCFGVFVVDFEQVNAGWDAALIITTYIEIKITCHIYTL